MPMKHLIWSLEQAENPVQLRKMVKSFSLQLQVRITTAIMVAMDTAVAEQEADTTGGYYGQDGGTNGSDGEDSSSATGGKGSGLDIGTLNITRFILSPGKAGTHMGGLGGGGGGILVNGEKPGGGDSHFGEGFGGGGYRYAGGSGGSGYGFPGCVLIEV